MHLGVQRFHAPAEHLRPSRELSNIAHGNAGIAQQLGGPTGGEDLDVQRGKPPGEFHDARLVKHAEQRVLDSNNPSQAEKRSIVCARERLRKAGTAGRGPEKKSGVILSRGLSTSLGRRRLQQGIPLPCSLSVFLSRAFSCARTRGSFRGRACPLFLRRLAWRQPVPDTTAQPSRFHGPARRKRCGIRRRAPPRTRGPLLLRRVRLRWPSRPRQRGAGRLPLSSAPTFCRTF